MFKKNVWGEVNEGGSNQSRGETLESIRMVVSLKFFLVMIDGTLFIMIYGRLVIIIIIIMGKVNELVQLEFSEYF